MKQGILVVNLGTPEKPNFFYVWRYLAAFLIDKRVINLPFPLRILLLYAFILPFRIRRTIHAYQSIWTKDGSPLLVNSQRFIKKLQATLGPNYEVVLGMRYGKPALATAVKRLLHCEKITVIPLYPQYSSAATGSSLEKILTILASQENPPFITVVRDFYQHANFIKAQTALIEPYMGNHDYILFSYHGLPQRQLLSISCKGRCGEECPSINDRNQACYRAQCFQTTRQIAQVLNLSKEKYSTAFQSRLGKATWIKPYTDFEFFKLRERGIQRLAIICPSFVADCLETLEEIGIRAQLQWQKLGGKQLTLIPCLNDNEQWVRAFANIIQRPF